MKLAWRLSRLSPLRTKLKAMSSQALSNVSPWATSGHMIRCLSRARSSSASQCCVHSSSCHPAGQNCLCFARSTGSIVFFTSSSSLFGVRNMPIGLLLLAQATTRRGGIRIRGKSRARAAGPCQARGQRLVVPPSAGHEGPNCCVPEFGSRVWFQSDNLAAGWR